MRKLGISGPPCSGKDTAAAYLVEEYGFKHVSTGDLLRAEADRRGINKDRDSLQRLGAHIRKLYGYDPLLQQALESCENDTVFTGIRTVDAANTILDQDNGRMLYIYSPIDDRYARSIERNRVDHVPYTTFVTQDRVEHEGNSESDTSLRAIESLASFAINNAGTQEDFFKDIDSIMATY